MSLPTNNRKGALLHLKNYSMKKLFLFYIDAKILNSVVHLLIVIS